MTENVAKFFSYLYSLKISLFGMDIKDNMPNFFLLRGEVFSFSGILLFDTCAAKGESPTSYLIESPVTCFVILVFGPVFSQNDHLHVHTSNYYNLPNFHRSRIDIKHFKITTQSALPCYLL